MKTIKQLMSEEDKKVTDLGKFKRKKEEKTRGQKLLADLAGEDAAREEHVRQAQQTHKTAQDRAMAGLKFNHPVGTSFTPKAGTKHLPGTYRILRHTYKLGLADKPYAVYHLHRHTDEHGTVIPNGPLYWFHMAGSRLDKEFDRQGPRGIK